MKLTTHLYLMLRSRMGGAILPLPQYPFTVWCSVKAEGQLYLSCLHVSFCTMPDMLEDDIRFGLMHRAIYSVFISLITILSQTVK